MKHHLAALPGSKVKKKSRKPPKEDEAVFLL